MNAAIGVRPMYCHRNSAGSGSLSVVVNTVDDTSRSPASRSRPATSSGSCIEKTALTKPPRSALICSTMARSRSSKNGGIRPGVLITIRPVGASTLRISATARGLCSP